MGKKPRQSKTITANVIVTAVAILAAIGAQDWIANYPQVAAGITAAIGIANVVLRFYTEEPIEP